MIPILSSADNYMLDCSQLWMKPVGQRVFQYGKVRGSEDFEGPADREEG
jgi:hypothetical protein